VDGWKKTSGGLNKNSGGYHKNYQNDEGNFMSSGSLVVDGSVVSSTLGSSHLF
jgi:hypothetical protein